jgi:hypothetical protein
VAGQGIEPSIFDGMDEFATVRQLEYLKAIREKKSYYAAAKACGVAPQVVKHSMQILRDKAARQGLSPKHDMTHTVPEGFTVKGVSTYYGEDGKPKGQWVKSSAGQQARDAAIREAFEAMAEDLPRLAPSVAPAVTVGQLATVYTLTDSHVGMLAWHKEGGEDWDLAIAERTLVGCFEQMVNASPPATVGFVNQLGDFLHSDGLLPVTPTSHHVLDQDGRFSKLVQTAVRILRRVVDLALTKHEKVVLLLAEGNHDMASSIWLRVMFRALYENEHRVEVIDSELPYYAYQHGKTMLAFHHGHLKKNDALPLLFAAQFPKVWGETVKRYVHCGHRHHMEEKEHSGVKVVQHPTLAARDAYAARGGWISERQVMAVTYHQEFGEVARNTVTPEMLSS